MVEIKLQNNIYLFEEVPNDAHDLGMETECEVSYRIPSGEYKRINTSSLNVSFNVNMILGFTKDITEEQAESIVEKYTEYETEREQLLHEMYVDYLEKGNYWMQDSSGIKLWAFKTAKESIQSLIQANGLDVNKNYLILKKL
jgi:hypothetical protein